MTVKPNIFIGSNYIKRIKDNIKIIKKLQYNARQFQKKI